MNYGVIFEPEAQLHLSKENWIHTFELELPNNIDMVNLSGCNRDAETCSVVNKILLEINQIRQETELHLNHTIETIKRLVPEHKISDKRRQTRAVLPFIGDLSKTLFNTATYDDVKLLARHINALNRLTTKVVKSVQHHEDDLSSFIRTVDERIGNVIKGIKENELAITHIQTQLFESFENLERSFATMGVLLSKQIERSRKLETRLNELIQGVFELVEGKLSPHLITPNTIRKTLIDIEGILRDKFSYFHLILTDPEDIYKKVQTFYTRNGAKLYISLKFPVSPFAQPLTLFKILSFPVPLNQTSNHATHLVDLPDLLAVTNGLTYYTVLDKTELFHCSRSKIIMCKINKALTPFTYNSCVLALFKNDKELIKQHCDFRVSLEHISPKFIELSHTSILVYKTKVLEFDCQTGKRMQPGCDFCIVHVPCGCSVSTSNMYLPPRLSQCHNNTQSNIHPVNLALLQQFFNGSLLQNVNGNSLFENPLKIEVPKFTIYNHSMSKIMADDRKSHLSLQKMAKAASQESVVFKSLTDSLLAGSISLEDTWPSSNDIILYVTTAVAGFSLIAFIITFLKLRKVILILTVLQQAHKVKAATLPSFIYKNQQPTATPTNYIFDNIDLTIEHYILTLCIFILLFVVILFVHVVKCKRNRTVVLAELTDGESCVHVPLMALAVCPTYWDIRSPHEVAMVTISGKLSPIVHFDWDQFELTNKLTNKTLHVQKNHTLSLLKGRTVRKLLRTTYSVHFFIQHERFIMPIV